MIKPKVTGDGGQRARGLRHILFTRSKFTRRSVPVPTHGRVRPNLLLPARQSTLTPGEQRENRPASWADATIRSFMRDYIKWTLSNDPDHIFFAQYCMLHGVYDDDVAEWRKRAKDLALWYERCMKAEQVCVAHMGARSKINGIAAIFYLKSQHKWRDSHGERALEAVLIQTDIRDLTK